MEVNPFKKVKSVGLGMTAKEENKTSLIQKYVSH